METTHGRTSENSLFRACRSNGFTIIICAETRSWHWGRESYSEIEDSDLPSVWTVRIADGLEAGLPHVCSYFSIFDCPVGLLRQLLRLLKSWLFGTVCDRANFLAWSPQTMVGILDEPKVLVRDLYTVWPLLVYSNLGE